MKAAPLFLFSSEGSKSYIANILWEAGCLYFAGRQKNVTSHSLKVIFGIAAEGMLNESKTEYNNEIRLAGL